MKIFGQLGALQAHVGEALGVGEWMTVDQPRIDQFAHATHDRQWIHVDPARAADGPFGATVAHGFLTLSLLPALCATAFHVEGSRMGVNYGLDRVRFPAPVPVGSRIRAACRLLEYTPLEQGAQLTIEATVEREGSEKPVCVAQMVSRRYY
ncbi:MaoC family dehydratase [Paraburkholderia ferrariae]|uniref:MaoC family dehydratase n=1 Tax=Paraburkholderia ferrariae TaxID=386056 RepID=UPI000488F90A|nr:MaoC family dehydratase [Paraburkholderia ferrariae]